MTIYKNFLLGDSNSYYDCFRQMASSVWCSSCIEIEKLTFRNGFVFGWITYPITLLLVRLLLAFIWVVIDKIHFNRFMHLTLFMHWLENFETLFWGNVSLFTQKSLIAQHVDEPSGCVRSCSLTGCGVGVSKIFQLVDFFKLKKKNWIKVCFELIECLWKPRRIKPAHSSNFLFSLMLQDKCTFKI
jgi:hypothetical protein